MHRFYSPDANFSLKHFSITDPHEIHHIHNVLHLKAGAKIQVFNRHNQEADVMIESITKDALKVKVQTVREASKGGLKIILACAPPKKDKFEWIIEKCTELGVDEIIPLKTKRSEVVFTDERMKGKLARFEKVVMNAAKQSKRMNIPKIHPMTDLNIVLQGLDPAGIHLFPSLNDRPIHIKEALSHLSKETVVTIFIGPEGDFTPEEVRLAKEAGCVAVSLGNTVLKVETAAIATVSFIRLLLIDNVIPVKV